ncbi:hypothetical protein HYR53_10695 [Candidatus Acetothermia bacterium]|nr:hypothetical protein [Candidatus Acetothermia bacterium]
MIRIVGIILLLIITASLSSLITNGDSSAQGIGSIHPISSMLTDRAAHTATRLADGRVLIAGGFGQGDNSYRASAELYDPSTDRFAATGSLASGKCCHSATRLPDGKILIAGGFNGQYLDNAELYDPATGTFTPTGRLTTPRMDHVAVLLDNGKVLLAGGVGTDWTFLDSAELYDPATGTFTSTGSMSAARESHTATKLMDGRVLITGGHQGRHAAIVIYDSAEIYDPATGTFSATGHLKQRRHKHDAGLLPDGRVLITGGSDERDDENAYTSSEIFDPATGSFSPAAEMPGIRYKHIGTSILLDNGNELVAGGARNAVLYDSKQNTFSVVPGDLGTAPLSRLFSTATLLLNGNVLITGGYGINQHVSGQAWVYSP